MYIYIYIYTCIHIYIYTHMHIAFYSVVVEDSDAWKTPLLPVLKGFVAAVPGAYHYYYYY